MQHVGLMLKFRVQFTESLTVMDTMAVHILTHIIMGLAVISNAVSAGGSVIRTAQLMNQSRRKNELFKRACSRHGKRGKGWYR